MFSTGTYIVNGSERRKILGECGEIRFVSCPDEVSYNYTRTIQELLRNGWTEEPEKDWEPQSNEKYWHAMDTGSVNYCFWVNDTIDHARRDFLGVYKSEAEARAMVEKIKAWRRGI